MTEIMAYTIMGLMVYAVAYLVIGCSITAIWKMWANNKVGIFWQYSIDRGLKMYYPGMHYFVKEYNVLYSIIYVLLWPVMVPAQTIMMTKVINRLTSRRCWF